VAARVVGIPALDMVTLNFADNARFETEAVEARALGFAGKLCIHPRQVELANHAFTPSAAELHRARSIVDAFEFNGGGVVVVEGRMVDNVIAAQASAVLDRYDG